VLYTSIVICTTGHILHKTPPGMVQITHCIHKTNFKIFPTQSVSENLMSRSMLQQITEEFWKSTKNLALKLLLIEKIFHLHTLHLYPAKTPKRTKKLLPNSYIKLLTYRRPIVRFLQKTKASSIITSHDFGPDYTLH